MMLTGRNGAIVLALAVVAFGLAPFITPPFRGYDPAIFPVVIARPAVQPAAYAFSIWGVIYLWLAAHAIFGLLRRADDAAWTAPRLPLAVSVLLGAGWLAIAPDYPILATVVILIMAATALAAFLIADTDRDRWMLSAPLAIYAGWLTAACAVSTGVVLAGYGWLPDAASALLMLAVVLGVAVTVQWRKPAMPVYGATVVWAIVAIVAVNWGVQPTVAYAAVAGAVIMAVSTAAITLRR